MALPHPLVAGSCRNRRQSPAGPKTAEASDIIPTVETALDQADLILLLLAAPSGDPAQQSRCNGITRLEKLLFLVGQETEVPAEVSDPFTFEPYHYGPYSRGVYDAVDLLKSLRLIEERRVEVTSGLDLGETFGTLDQADINDVASYVERQILLTQDGQAVARVLSTRFSAKSKLELVDLKGKYGAMPLRQLLRYVYGKYPAFAARSRIRNSL